MKKYKYNIFAVLIAALTFAACSDDEGTEPGSDSSPIITLYSYAAVRPNNPDNDLMLKFAANSKTKEAYYILQKTTDAEQLISSLGEQGFMDYVIEHGIKIDGISGQKEGAVADVTLTDLYGVYTITAVAVDGNKKTMTQTTFNGLDWEDVVSGTYTFSAVPKLSAALGLTTAATTLQICTTNSNLYRFKDVFGDGYSLKINLIDYSGSDADGDYQFFRVPQQETPYIYGTYGSVGLRDIGYWQNNDQMVTTGGYESGMYANHNCFIYVQYFVAAGNLGYGYDYFEAN